MRYRWTYCVVQGPKVVPELGLLAPDFVAWLDQMGAQGWELVELGTFAKAKFVYHSQGHVGIFKRQVPVADPASTELGT